MSKNSLILLALAVFLAIYFKPTSEYPYTIYTNPEGTTAIVLDKKTGESYRYFRNRDDKGDTTDEGWTPVLYSNIDIKGSTPVVLQKKLKEFAVNLKTSWRRVASDPRYKKASPKEQNRIKEDWLKHYFESN